MDFFGSCFLFEIYNEIEPKTNAAMVVKNANLYKGVTAKINDNTVTINPKTTNTVFICLYLFDFYLSDGIR